MEEALRLHPPTPIYERLARVADTLPSGAAVKPGTLVLICPYVLHRDPRLFEDPEAYAPHRFNLALPGGLAVRVAARSGARV